MRNYLTYLPLRILVPGLLVLMVLLLNLYTYGVSIPAIEAQVEKDVKGYFAETVNRVQGSIRYLFQHDNRDAVVREISNLGAVDGFNQVLLFDEHNVVIASNRFSSLGSSLGKVRQALPRIDLSRFERIRNDQTSELVWDEAMQVLTGYYSVPVGLSRNSLYSDRIGMLYVEFDATHRKQNSVDYIREQTVRFSTVVTAALVALMFMLHFMVWQRARRVVEAARRVSSGEMGSHAGLTGRDELAMIGRAFDQMIDKLQAEREQIKSGESRIRAIVETVVDGIISIDTRGIIQAVNPATERIFGYLTQEMVGRNVNMLMPEPYRSAHDNYIRNYCETGKKKVIGIGREVVGRRKDGSTFPMDLAVSEMKIGDERMFTGIVRDITERKKIERLKSEFVSTVSHELRTPLTSIRGALGLILGKASAGLPDKVKGLLETANRNSERLTLLINDILDLEKIESGRLDFELRPLDLCAVARQAVVANEGYAQQHRVILRENIAVASAMVVGDEHRLMQVFANLISNAVKYSLPEGEVQVSVRREGGSFRVAIRDFGRGIPDEFRERMFQRFAQADSSDTREKGGTGLGLSITKAIVERHGGIIDYTSRMGEGAEFFFTIPAWNESPAEITRQEQSVPVLLICEDNSDVAMILSEMLRADGLIADVAGSASAALDLLAKKHYQALLLDLTLPDRDGLELVRELRDRPDTAELPIIVVSGRAEEGRASWTGEAQSVADWLQKPIDPERLMQSVHHVLAKGAGVRILHVEDDPDVIQIVHELVKDIGECDPATSLQEARRLLAAGQYDLVLLDLTLPDGYGAELLGDTQGRIPVVVFSGSEAPADISRSIAAALTKSRTSNEQLLQTIRRVIKR